jgi:hypothetical protein
LQTFWDLPESERALMIAYEEAKNEMSSYEYQAMENQKPPKL